MEKKYDYCHRERSVTVGFRVSPEESQMINDLVAISGMTKQDYITAKLLNRDIIVQGNPRVYNMLRNSLQKVLTELKSLKRCEDVPPELWILIEQINKTLYGLKGSEENG